MISGEKLQALKDYLSMLSLVSNNITQTFETISLYSVIENNTEAAKTESFMQRELSPLKVQGPVVLKLYSIPLLLGQRVIY